MQRPILFITLIALTSCGDATSPEPGRTATHSAALQSTQFTPRSWEAPLSQASVTDETFRHSLQADVPEADGVVLLDDKDDDNGHRFAVGNQIWARESGSRGKFTGVFTLESEPITADQKISWEATKGPRVARPAVPTVARTLSDELATMTASDRVEVWIYLAEPPSNEPVIYRLQRRIANGDILTEDGKERVHEELVLEQAAAVQPVVSSVAMEVDGLGGTVVATCKVLPCLRAQLTPDQLRTIASRDAVARIDPTYPPAPGAISGAAVSRGSQMVDQSQWDQFQDDNYLGEKADLMGDMNRPVRAGVMEHKELDHDHLAFDDSHAGSSRIALMRKCDAGNCWTKSSFTNPHGHATRVSGLLVGDITDGQDPNISDANERVRRSGYAREAELFFWNTPDDGDIGTGLDDVVLYSSFMDVLSMSIWEPLSADPGCQGTGTTARQLNDVFLAGVLPVNAAGNSGHSDDWWNCLVHTPGTALGAYVVGGHATNAISGNQQDVRSGPIAPQSARGGTAYEGYRTIVDQTSAYCRVLMLNANAGKSCSSDSDCPDTVCTNSECEPYDKTATGNRSQCGTTYAAPTVAGGAIQLIDFYQDILGNDIEDPGILTISLLLMGDLQGENGVTLDSGFSNLWGSGRFKMRRWDYEGLDADHQFYDFQTCIDDGENYHLILNGGQPIPADTDALKAVIFYYDYRHELGYSIDDIDLHLQEKVNGNWTTQRSSMHRYDEKERVFWDDFSGANEWRLRFSGYDVTNDYQGCGINSMRVYIGVFWEDSDRDDPAIHNNGPGSNTDPED